MEDQSMHASIFMKDPIAPLLPCSELVEQLGSTLEREEFMSLWTFGGTTTAVKKVEVSTIHLQTFKDRETVPIEVTVYLYSKNCSPIAEFCHSRPT